jgi:hypothetical protein
MDPACTEACDSGGVETATCHANCTVVVNTPPTCGDGTVNQASEECDDGPNGSATCTKDCKKINFPQCFSCINSDMDLGPFQQDQCVTPYPDGSCVSIETCYIETGCYSPIPATCYCGSDTSANCEGDSFVPSGPCADLIKTAVGPGLKNSDYLAKATLLTNAAGVAGAVVSAAEDPAGNCKASCVK